MTEDDLKEILKRPNYGIAGTIKSSIKSSIGKGTIASEIRDSGEAADLEQHTRCQSVRAEKDTINYKGQCCIRVKVFRKRLADPDGNCYKYAIDFLRYCGALADDNEREVRIIFEGQTKVGTDQEEKTEITIEYQEVDFDNLWVKTRI